MLWKAEEDLEFGTKPYSLNESGVLRDLPLAVSRSFLGSRFGIFLAEFVINPDEISKQKSEQDGPYNDPEKIVIPCRIPIDDTVLHFRSHILLMHIRRAIRPSIHCHLKPLIQNLFLFHTGSIIDQERIHASPIFKNNASNRWTLNLIMIPNNYNMLSNYFIKWNTHFILLGGTESILARFFPFWRELEIHDNFRFSPPVLTFSP